VYTQNSSTTSIHSLAGGYLEGLRTKQFSEHKLQMLEISSL